MPTLYYYNNTTSTWEPAIVGEIGATGPQGATGPAGSGSTGATGVAGVDGATGATGAIGNTLLANLDANGFFISNAANITANYFVGVATDVVVEAVNNNYSYHVVLTTGPGDTTLHNDADDNFQYNPQDGVLTVTRVDTQYLSVLNSVLSNLIPFDSVPLTLGNATNPWNDLYLSNSTIYLGNATISANGNSIVVDSITVNDGNIGIIGNIASINLDGNVSNVLAGDGTWIAAGGGGNANTGNVTFDNINIIGTGNLHLQPDPANTGSYLDIFLSSGPDLHLVASAAANLILGKDDGPNVMTSWDGNVYVQSWNTGSNTQGGVWNFGEDGTTTFPTLTVDLHNGGNQTAQTLQFGDPNQQAIITGPTPALNDNAQRLIIQGQRGNGTGEASPVPLPR